MTDLKPCPWCGSPARLLQMAHMERDEMVDALAAAIGLPSTAYRGAPANVECSNQDCQASGPFLASAEQAEKAWNDLARLSARHAEAVKLLREAHGSVEYEAQDLEASYGERLMHKQEPVRELLKAIDAFLAQEDK